MRKGLTFNIKSKFLGNIATLMTGSTLAQLVPIAISPILTRIYTPKDFGVLAIYVAVTSIISVIVTGRYELAILLPKKQADADCLAALSIVFTILVSLAALILIFIFNEQLATFLGNPDIDSWLYLVPVSTFFAGCYQTFNYWNNRKKLYSRLAYSRVTQNTTTSISQVCIGFITQGGLVIGSILGQAIASIILVVISYDKKVICNINRLKILANAKRYKKFPTLSTIGAMFDASAVQVPVLILTKYFTSSITGAFSFTFKVLNMPAALISAAVSQVLFQEFAAIYNQNPSRLLRRLLKVFLGLLTICLPFVVLMIFYGSEIFVFVFGEDWVEAGDFAALLSVVVAIRFSVSPISCVLTVTQEIKKTTLWQVAYFISILSVMLYFSGAEIKVFLTAFVIHEMVMYAIYFLIILRSVTKVHKKIFRNGSAGKF